MISYCYTFSFNGRRLGIVTSHQPISQSFIVLIVITIDLIQLMRHCSDPSDHFSLSLSLFKALYTCTVLVEPFLLNKGHLRHFSCPILILYYVKCDPSAKDISIKRTSLLVPMVSVIKGFHCILTYICVCMVIETCSTIH